MDTTRFEDMTFYPHSDIENVVIQGAPINCVHQYLLLLPTVNRVDERTYADFCLDFLAMVFRAEPSLNHSIWDSLKV